MILNETNNDSLVDISKELDNGGATVFLNTETIELSEILMFKAPALKIVGNSSTGKTSIACIGTEEGIQIR